MLKLLTEPNILLDVSNIYLSRLNQWVDENLVQL